MSTYQNAFTVRTNRREMLLDITDIVRNYAESHGVVAGMVNVYVRGATAAVMIQENWDNSVQNDVVTFLRGIIPRGGWEHDAQDGNADSHLKAGLVGPSETIPIINGQLGLSRWQNIFICEFDGPRETREIVVTVYN